MSLPPRYTLCPTAVLRMRMPIHLKWTYLVLYALAWTHQYYYVNETQEQLADIFSDLEGKQIEPRGIRQRLSDLAERGLIERRQVGGRYRTYLMVRHDQIPDPATGMQSRGDAPNVTQGGPGDAVERHPNSNNGAGGVEISVSEPNKHQQYSTMGDVELFQQNRGLLGVLGINEPVRTRLAGESWVTPEYLEAWIAYQVQEGARGDLLGPGYFVVKIGEGEEPPGDWRERLEGRLQEAEGDTYVSGKYADYIKS